MIRLDELLTAAEREQVKEERQLPSVELVSEVSM